jgi:hypothetical protein
MVSEFELGIVVALCYALIIYALTVVYNRDRENRVKELIISYFKKGEDNKEK